MLVTFVLVAAKRNFEKQNLPCRSAYFFLKGTWNQSGKIAPSLKMHLILIQLRNTRDCWAKPNLSRQIFFGWSLEI